MEFKHKKIIATVMTAALVAPIAGTVAMAENTAPGTPEEQADITNWIASSPQQISNSMTMQHIDLNNLNGVKYVIQWGDTLSGISAATGISVAKLCYDNNIQNADLIYAGNILILNRNGSVPAGYVPNVDPYVVAQAKVTINNGPTNVTVNVRPQSIENNDNSDTDNSKTIYHVAGDDDDSESSSASTSHKRNSKTHKLSATTIVDKLTDANDNDNLSFEVADDDDDAKSVDVDTDELLSDIKNHEYKDAVQLISDALDDSDKDTTIYIDYVDGELKVTASQNDEDSSSSSQDKEDDSSSSDNDENSEDQTESSQDGDEDNSQTINDQQSTDSSVDDE